MRDFFNKNIIICIHGLANKPPKRLLKNWWKKSIREGLIHIGQRKFFFQMELAYWAHLMYPHPLKKEIQNEEDDLYIETPYAPSPVKKNNRKPSRLKRKFLNLVEKGLDFISFKKNSLFKIDSLSEIIIKNLYKDLHQYYYGLQESRSIKNKTSKEAIRKVLADLLLKHRDKEILLIAHSMGTIIAYDVLWQLRKELNIHTLITIGSPLGLPFIIKQIMAEQNIEIDKETKPSTPENIKNHWYNFSDLKDTVAVNFDLHDDYNKNSKNIGPIDFEIFNDYEYKGLRDYHKSYGYLRTPEVSAVISDFLQKEGFFGQIIFLIRKIFLRD